MHEETNYEVKSLFLTMMIDWRSLKNYIKQRYIIWPQLNIILWSTLIAFLLFGYIQFSNLGKEVNELRKIVCQESEGKHASSILATR